MDVRGPIFKTMGRNFFLIFQISKQTYFNQSWPIKPTNWKSKQLTDGFDIVLGLGEGNLHTNGAGNISVLFILKANS